MARWLALFLSILVVHHGEGARILGLFPIAHPSHMISYSVLMEELVRRGHEVTVISGYPRETPLANYTDIVTDLSFVRNNIPNLLSNDTWQILYFLHPKFLYEMGVNLCERTLETPEVQKLINDNEQHFDLIIIELFISECFYGFVHKYNAPFIHISSNSVNMIIGDGVGNPHTPSYIPFVTQGPVCKMRFVERLLNTVVNLFGVALRELLIHPYHSEIMYRQFKDPSMPSTRETETNASLLLINIHSSVAFPRPLTPNTIEVGGMHIRPGKRLPKDLQKFMDDAPHGVVYFSLGTLVASKHMPHYMRQSLVDAFSKLKQKVLWKWNAEDIPGLPSNIKTAKWLPQREVLAHPNLRAFLTHSGLLSVEEATYYAIPLVVIPVGGDQVLNAQCVVCKGYGVELDLRNITTESVSWALDEVLNNPKYKENARRVSSIYRDQPMSPLETAVYWTEYVIRHKGAPHMRSAALDLYWFQYYLLDVIAFLAGLGLICIFIIWLTCRTLYRVVASKKSVKQPKKQSKAKKID